MKTVDDGERGRAGDESGSCRRRRRRWLLAGAVGLLLAVCLPAAAWAAPAGGGIESVKEFTTRLTTYVTAIAASVAVLFMAVNGMRYITSGGNPMKQSEAKSGIVSAGVGLAVALSANVLVQLVVSALG